eukprot:Hpha_TRINITY_DN15307_c5_g13::TRINITY_DN15307_c5_g13_i1::g.92286::m.92286
MPVIETPEGLAPPPRKVSPKVDSDVEYLVRSGAALLLHRILERIIDDRAPDPISALRTALQKSDLQLPPRQLVSFVSEAGAFDQSVMLEVLSSSSPPVLTPSTPMYDAYHDAACAAADLLFSSTVSQHGYEAASGVLNEQARAGSRPLPVLASRLAAAKADMCVIADCGVGAPEAAQARPQTSAASPAGAEEVRGPPPGAPREPVHMSVIVPVGVPGAEGFEEEQLRRWMKQLRWLTAIPSGGVRVSFRLCIAEVSRNVQHPTPAAITRSFVARRGGCDQVSVTTGCVGFGDALHQGLATAQVMCPDEVPADRHYVCFGDATDILHLCCLAQLVRCVATNSASTGVVASYAVTEETSSVPGSSVWPYAGSKAHKQSIALFRRLAPVSFLHETGDCFTRMLIVKMSGLQAVNAIHGHLLCKGRTTALMEIFARLAVQADRDKRKNPPFVSVAIPHEEPHKPGDLSPEPELDLASWKQLGNSLVSEQMRKRKDDPAKWLEWLEANTDFTFKQFLAQPSPLLLQADTDKAVRNAAAMPLPPPPPKP